MRHAVGGFCFVMIAAAGLAAAQRAPASRVTTKKLNITISRETTYVDGPVRPDGTIDYVAAIQKILRAGVTPANNAAVPILQAFGPGAISPPEVLPLALEALQIESLPAAGDYFVPIEDVAERLSVDARQTRDQKDEARSRPWSRSEFPVVAAWLEANKRPLELIVEASKRSRFYLITPSPDPEAGALGIQVPMLRHTRNAAKLLLARAMLRLYQGDSDGARADVLAVHRLGRLTGRGGVALHYMVSVAIDGMASIADHAMIADRALTADQARQYLTELQSLPPLPSAAEAVSVERMIQLDVIMMAARLGAPRVLEALEAVAAGDLSPMEQVLPSGDVTVDWNVALTLCNETADAQAAVFRITDSARFDRAQAAFDRRMMAMKGQAVPKLMALRAKSVAGADPTDPALAREAGEAYGTMLVVALWPALGGMTWIGDYTEMQFELTKVALAIGIGMAEHGRPPSRLQSLVPKYLKALPTDRFSGKLPIYRRRGAGYLLYSVGKNRMDEGGGEDPGNCDDIIIRVK